VAIAVRATNGSGGASGNAPILGYIVLGDLVNGKVSSTTLIGRTMGCGAAVYHKGRLQNELHVKVNRTQIGAHPDATYRDTWLTASASMNMELEVWYDRHGQMGNTTKDVLMQGG
jgi:hypothetical protein